MKKFNIICSFLVIFTASAFIITLSQNLTLRSAEVYLFYFNDCRVVSKLYTSLDNNEMADGIAEFMNSWKPEEFQIYQDTGYDLQGIFSQDDSHNMMTIKKCLDISSIVMIVSLILSVAIYVHLIKEGQKKILRKRYIISMILTIIIGISNSVMLTTNTGKAWLAKELGLLPLGEDSALNILLGGDFLYTGTMLFNLIGVIVLALISYLIFKLTKPPRIFY